MGDANKLCYKANDGRLAYKASGDDAGKLVYKVDAGQLTTIAFAWAADGRDLDMCAYWTGAPDMKVGYGYLYTQDPTEFTSGAYYIQHSGDKRGTDDSEWVKIKMTPWSGGARTFDVHLNFFEYNSSAYPASKCTVIATQANGRSIILRDVACGTTYHSKALDSDPGVRVTFDATGHLQSMEVI